GVAPLLERVESVLVLAPLLLLVRGVGQISGIGWVVVHPAIQRGVTHDLVGAHLNPPPRRHPQRIGAGPAEWRADGDASAAFTGDLSHRPTLSSAMRSSLAMLRAV